ncbi:hypothetical protein SKAU_G00354810 [Synaphobranchus kaupii]|uniref:Secreted protein n=1 Tax=Synaphobranchus kaupii TaxID=118154 RepID=A0A9Q1EH67_SYNKA|nr:hypothetical protein SKAU_G00354810 [Synaphobranchus kaupii]
MKRGLFSSDALLILIPLPRVASTPAHTGTRDLYWEAIGRLHQHAVTYDPGQWPHLLRPLPIGSLASFSYYHRHPPLPLPPFLIFSF